MLVHLERLSPQVLRICLNKGGTRAANGLSPRLLLFDYRAILGQYGSYSPNEYVVTKDTVTGGTVVKMPSECIYIALARYSLDGRWEFVTQVAIKQAQ